MTGRRTSCVMFHTVGTVLENWTWKHLTMPWQKFDALLKKLKANKYRTVTLDEYRDIFASGKLEQERVVALTFDDGYLDNWVYAAPLLEKYGFCGTVFVSGDFIAPGTEARKQWNGTAHDNPDTDGFLNIGELRALDQSGVLDVQSHGITHTWYPSGPSIVDFRHPGDSYHWLDWNRNPNDKWRKIQPEEDPSRWGEPVYEHRKALEAPRFFPDEDLAAALAGYVADKGRDFFAGPGWRETLHEQARRMLDGKKSGEFESEAGFKARVKGELEISSKLLGELLNKKIRYLCWPGGGYDRHTFELAAEFYAGTTISASGDRARPQGIDEHGCFRFLRFGPMHTGGYADIRYLGALTNCLHIEERRTGKKSARLLRGGLTRLAQWGVI